MLLCVAVVVYGPLCFPFTFAYWWSMSRKQCIADPQFNPVLGCLGVVDTRLRLFMSVEHHHTRTNRAEQQDKAAGDRC